MRDFAPWFNNRFPIDGTLSREKAWDLLADAIDGDPNCVLTMANGHIILELDGIDPETPGWRIAGASSLVAMETLQVIKVILAALGPDFRTTTPRQTSSWSPPEEEIETLNLPILFGNGPTMSSATLAAARRRDALNAMPDIVAAPRERLRAFLSEQAMPEVYAAYVAKGDEAR